MFALVEKSVADVEKVTHISPLALPRLRFLMASSAARVAQSLLCYGSLVGSDEGRLAVAVKIVGDRISANHWQARCNLAFAAIGFIQVRPLPPVNGMFDTAASRS